MKICTMCKKELPYSSFHKDVSRKSWYRNKCRRCCNASDRKRYEKTHENYMPRWERANYELQKNDVMYHKIHKERFKIYIEQRRELHNAQDSKRRCIIRKSYDWTITQKSLIKLLEHQKYKCNICKISIKHKKHLDHIMPLSKWWKHTIFNIQYLCPQCNLKKHAKITQPIGLFN